MGPFIEESKNHGAFRGPRPVPPPRPGGRVKGGMTLVEILIVIVIIGILLMIGIMSLRDIVPAFQLRSAVRGTATMAEQARLMAANRQKPVRLVLDCRRRVADGGSQTPCIASFYQANFDAAQNGAFLNWQKINGDGVPVDRNIPESGSRLLGSRVDIKLSDNPAGVPIASDHDQNLYWAVFFPKGQARTSHTPLVLEYTAGRLKGHWAVFFNNQTGRVTTTRRDD